MVCWMAESTDTNMDTDSCSAPSSGPTCSGSESSSSDWSNTAAQGSGQSSSDNTPESMASSGPSSGDTEPIRDPASEGGDGEQDDDSQPLTQPISLFEEDAGGDARSDPSGPQLYPMSSLFSLFVLTRPTTTFGRINSDVNFSEGDRLWPSYSSNHFKIDLQASSTGQDAFLTDKSSNGTFVNGKKVGKDQCINLSNHDYISLALQQNRVYLYVDRPSDEQNSYPACIRDKYLVTRELGKGASGIVKLPCIVKQHDFLESDDNVYVILEMADGGELFHRITSSGRLSEAISKLLFFQMLLAVKYLHDNKVAHRDLKPENILLADANTNETTVKITDFGLAKLIGLDSLMRTYCGTPSYLAPEILTTQGVGQYTEKVDNWSLGVNLFICLGGYPPFNEERTESDGPVYNQIVSGNFTFLEAPFRDVSDQAKDLIKKLLVVDVDERLSLTDALHHPWFDDAEMKRKVSHILKMDLDVLPPPRAQSQPSPPGSPVRSGQKRPSNANGPDSPSSSGRDAKSARVV